MAISTYSTSLTITGKKGSATTDTSTTVPIYDFPDMGSDPETIDVTTLGNDQYVYIAGIKGSSSLTFNANYDTDVFDELDKRTKPQTCVLKLQDNHTLTWTGTISVRIAGGGVNEKVSMAITIVPSTTIAYA